MMLDISVRTNKNMYSPRYKTDCIHSIVAPLPNPPHVPLHIISQLASADNVGANSEKQMPISTITLDPTHFGLRPLSQLDPTRTLVSSSFWCVLSAIISTVFMNDTRKYITIAFLKDDASAASPHCKMHGCFLFFWLSFGLLHGCPWGPYGCSEAAFGCPWGCIWLLRGSIWLPMGSMWLLRGCIWVPLGLHMAAQRLHMAAHGAAYGCSEAAFGCREVAFCCTGAVYGSHVADMQQMLHLAGLGWGPRREGRRLGGGSQGGFGSLIHQPG